MLSLLRIFFLILTQNKNMEIRRKVESLMPEKKNHFPILVNNFRIVARVLETKKKIKIVKLLVTKLILIKVWGE